MKKLIFVSGTGRSGTHLVGRSLSSHPEIIGRIEDPETFQLITKVASRQDYQLSWITKWNKKKLYRKLNQLYDQSQFSILEKSHPSLWLVDDLINNFPEAYFICVYRDVGPTVSSMLEHKGVLSWYSKLPLNKVDRFLGINHSNVNEFKDYSIEEKCVLRWISHKNEIEKLQSKYPNRIYVIKYDDYMMDSKKKLKEVATFLDISDNFAPEDLKIDSLDKWKNKLSKEQISLVNKALK